MDCRTCNHAYYENDLLYCRIDVHGDDFMLDCEKAECPYFIGDDNV